MQCLCVLGTTLLIHTINEKYYTNLSDKLQDPEIDYKRWWGIVKSHYGNKIYSNIPTLLEGDQMITDAKEKATLNLTTISVLYVRLKTVMLPYHVYLLFKILSIYSQYFHFRTRNKYFIEKC